MHPRFSDPAPQENAVPPSPHSTPNVDEEWCEDCGDLVKRHKRCKNGQLLCKKLFRLECWGCYHSFAFKLSKYRSNRSWIVDQHMPSCEYCKSNEYVGIKEALEPKRGIISNKPHLVALCGYCSKGREDICPQANRGKWGE